MSGVHERDDVSALHIVNVKQFAIGVCSWDLKDRAILQIPIRWVTAWG